MTSETKSAFLTTEFWVFILSNLVTVTDTLPIPDHYQWVFTAITAVGYLISRGIAKSGVAHGEVAPHVIITPDTDESVSPPTLAAPSQVVTAQRRVVD